MLERFMNAQIRAQFDENTDACWLKKTVFRNVLSVVRVYLKLQASLSEPFPGGDFPTTLDLVPEHEEHAAI